LGWTFKPLSITFFMVGLGLCDAVRVILSRFRGREGAASSLLGN